MYNEVKEYKEKYFKTEVVASFVEVCFFGGFDYKEIFEMASFIMGEEVNMSNIMKYRSLIMFELNKLYPDLKRNLFMNNDDILSEKEINKYKEKYLKKYGMYMLVRTRPKVYSDNNIKKYTLKRKNK